LVFGLPHGEDLLQLGCGAWCRFTAGVEASRVPHLATGRVASIAYALDRGQRVRLWRSRLLPFRLLFGREERFTQFDLKKIEE
jgi:hypothetical protein